MHHRQLIVKTCLLLLLFNISHGDVYHMASRRSSSRELRNEAEMSPEFWAAEARAAIATREARGAHRIHEKYEAHGADGAGPRHARNVVMFLGDGMSVPTLAAARTLLGQRRGASGEEAQLAFEAFPTVGLAKTYCVNAQTADSACSATAYLCGAKANLGTLGVDARVSRGACKDAADEQRHVASIAAWALAAGRDAGARGDDDARDACPRADPTLADLTEAAIRSLSRNEEGFFLFVEGGRIDHAHHENLVHLALDETIELSAAVARATELLPEEDSLIVVTSDHAHVMTLNGYTGRGGDILGPSDDIGDDGVPYMTLSYANGPGYRPAETYGRVDVSQDDYRSARFASPAGVPLQSETHGGEDVGVFARGVAHGMFSGLYEQSQLPHLMAYAACIGPGPHICDATA